MAGAAARQTEVVADLVSKAAKRLADAGDEEDREDAAEDLLRLAELGSPGAVMAAVEPLLPSESTEVRRAAVRVAGGLACLGDVSAASAALHAFADSEEPVRRAGAAAVAALGGSSSSTEAAVSTRPSGAAAAAAVDASVAAVGHKSWQVRIAALCTIEQLLGSKQASTPKVVGAVSGRLDDDHADVRKAAIRILGKIVKSSDGATAAAAVAGVVAGSASVHGDVRKELSPQLQSLRKGDAKTVSAVAALLKSDNRWEVRFAASHALARLARQGEPEAEARTPLLAALEDERAEVRAASIDALGKLASKNDAAVAAALVARLGDDAGEVRGKAMRALPVFVDQSDPPATVVSALVEQLQAPAWEARVCASRAARRLLARRQGGTKLTSALIACTKDPEYMVRYDAATSLRVLAGPEELERATRAVEPLLSDDHLAVRAFAVWSLSGLTPCGYGSTLGTFAAIALAALLALVACFASLGGGAEPASPSPPLAPAEIDGNGLFGFLGGFLWATSTLVRILAAWGLAQVLVKGYGSPGGLAAGFVAVAIGGAAALRW